MARRGWRADPVSTAAGTAQAGPRPAGSDGAGTRGHGTRARRPRPRTGAAVRPSSSSRDRPPSCRPCGRPPLATRGRPAGARRRPELRQETVRLWGTLESQLAGTLRDARRASSPAWRSPPACGTASWRSSPGSRPAAQAAYDRLVEVIRERHGDTVFSTGPDGRRPRRRRAGGAGAHGRDRRVVHRRPAGRPADRPARLVGVGAGRGGRVRELGQGAAARRARPRCSPSTGAVQPGGRDRAGRGRPRAVRGRRRGRDHRRRRSGRRHAGEAGRAPCTCACSAPTAARQLRALRLPRLPRRRCGTGPSRWRCRCCATCCSAARPPERADGRRRSPGRRPVGTVPRMSATHEVTNQVPPLIGHDPIAGDAALAEACLRHADAATLDSLAELGRAGRQRAGPGVGAAGQREPAEAPHPRPVRPPGRRGRVPPAWHELMRTAVENGLAGRAVGRSRRPAIAHAHVRRAVGYVGWTQVEMGHGCPVTMTYAAVPALRAAPELAARYEPGLTGHGLPVRADRADGEAGPDRRHGHDREAGRLRRAGQHHPRRPAARRHLRA